MRITKETLKRAFRTFIQAVIAYIAVNLASVNFADGRETVRAALTALAVSAVAAGLSAVMNLEKKGTDEYDNE